jgi:hypothetical protein
MTIAERIVSVLPEHGHYVEPFAGSLAVLLAKRPSRMETVNDLDGDIVNHWKVLRNRPDELARVCALTPHARSEWESCRDDHHSDEDELERARRFWTAVTQARSNRLTRTGWRHYVDPGATGTAFPEYLDAYVDRMAGAAARMHHVKVTIQDGLRSSEGAVALGRLLGEYFAEVDEVIDAITPEETEQSLAALLAGQHANPYGLDGGPETISQAEQEYRGEVVQSGPTPEHREPLEDYVARFGGPLPGDPGYVSRPLPPEEEARLDQLIEEALAERAADRPAPRPRQLPCEVCGVGVLTSYVEANGGRQRHGHHPEGS